MWSIQAPSVINKFVESDLKDYDCLHGFTLKLKNKESKKITKINNPMKIKEIEDYPDTMPGKYTFELDKEIKYPIHCPYVEINLPVVDGHFMGMKNLESFSCGFVDNIVPPYCFSDCQDLENVDLYDIHTVSVGAFQNCDYSIKNINIHTDSKTLRFKFKSIGFFYKHATINIVNKTELIFDDYWTESHNPEFTIMMAGRKIEYNGVRGFRY